MEESPRKRKPAGSAKENKPARKSFPSKKSSDERSGNRKSADFSSAPTERKRTYLKKSDSEQDSDRPFRRKYSDSRTEEKREDSFKSARPRSSDFKSGRSKLGSRTDSESRSFERKSERDSGSGDSGFRSERKKFSDRGESESRPYSKRPPDRERRPSDSSFRPGRKKFEEGGESSSARPFRKRTDRDSHSSPSDFKPGRKKFGERREDAAGSRDSARPAGTYKEFKERKAGGGKARSEESTSFRKYARDSDSFGKKSYKSRAPFGEDQELSPDQQFRRPSDKAPAIPGNIRLNKYLAHAGVASRRKADELILAGKVRVNGAVITEMGYRLASGDKVEFNQQHISPESKVYVLLNKPKDYITTTSDEKDRRTIMDLIAGVYRNFEKHRRPRLYPVGRLDRNTSGVLLITNDGELAQALTHPSKGVQKVYHVVLNKNFRKEDFDRVAEGGLVLEDGIASVDEIAYPNPDNRKEVGIQIHTGKNRFVRRIFEALEYEVVKLDRVYFAGLTKKDLPRGKWRFLTEEEVRMLKYFQR